MALNLNAFIIQVAVSTVIGAPVLWLAGRTLVGEDKAKFTDAAWIIILGNVIGAIFGAIISGLVGGIVQIILWLYLVRHFFDCGWGKAFFISLLTTILFFVIGFALAAAGFTFLRVLS